MFEDIKLAEKKSSFKVLSENIKRWCRYNS